ncbi:MAG: DUF512 domain-containing protein, partial [Eubacteriales bacterium]
MGYIVKTVDPNSIAEEVGIMPGDEIVDFNNQPFVDIIDFYFFVSKQRFSIGYINEKGETVKVKIQKLPEENLGITFKEDILGRSRHCGNRCIFCFVDQLPKGMRKSLYHKDEDWRYSLIFGNYVTLSFLSRTDLKRIKRRKISNLYVSVHTVDEQLRRQMLGREKIRPIKPLLRKLARFGVNMHAQIVLVPGVNDGDYLKESYRFLKSLYPKVQSVSVIPLGLTAHREGLVELSEVTEEKAAFLIDRISQWQEECRKEFGTGFVYASDEMFIKAKRAMPKRDYYDGYPQIENGVGLVTKFDDEFWMAMNKTKQAEPRFAHCSIISGEASYRYVKEYAQAINQRFGTDIKVICAKNNFFGGGVNVTALLTGSDVLTATEGKELGEALFITAYAFREGENVMLDDITITDLEQRL